MGDEVDFLHVDKHQSFLQVFYKLIVLLWLCVARNAQSTQNNKFAISFQYLKEIVKDEVHFLHSDKHESFLQIDNTSLMGWSSIPSSQNSKFPISLQDLKKEVRDEVDFLHAYKHKSFLQVNFNIKVCYKVILSLLMGITKHPQSTQSNKLVISLQYPKTEIRDGVHFCMQIIIKVSTN